MKSKSLIFLNILFIFALFFIPFTLAFGTPATPVVPLRHEGTYSNGWKILPNFLASIFLDSAETKCYSVKADRSYFVPTRTTSEWQAFLSVAILIPTINISICESQAIHEAIDNVNGDTTINAAEKTKITSALSSMDFSALSAAEVIYANYVLEKPTVDAAWDDAATLQDSFELRLSLVLSEAASKNPADFRVTIASRDPQGRILPAEVLEFANALLDSPSLRAEWGVTEYDAQSLVNSAEVVIENKANIDTLAARSIALEALTEQYSDYLNTAESGGQSEPPEDPCMSGGCTEPGCFTAGTLISTLTGEKDITTLKVGDYVLSYDINKNKSVESKIAKVLVHEKNTNWYYLIKTENSQVEVTSVHPFYIGNGEYKEAENLKAGDTIYEKINENVVQEKILSKEKVNLSQFITVYNLELEKDSPRNYFANGYLVHNKYSL